MLTYGPATSGDISQFYGKIDKTIKAVCVWRNDVPMLIVGLSITKGVATFFSEHKMSETELKSVTVWRAVKAAMALVDASKRPVISIAESVCGHKNLQRLGFEYVSMGVYKWRS